MIADASLGERGTHQRQNETSLEIRRGGGDIGRLQKQSLGLDITGRNTNWRQGAASITEHQRLCARVY